MQWSCKVSSSSTLEEDFDQRKRGRGGAGGNIDGMGELKQNLYALFWCFWPGKKISTCVCSSKCSERKRERKRERWEITIIQVGSYIYLSKWIVWKIYPKVHICCMQSWSHGVESKKDRHHHLCYWVYQCTGSNAISSQSLIIFCAIIFNMLHAKPEVGVGRKENWKNKTIFSGYDSKATVRASSYS